MNKPLYLGAFFLEKPARVASFRLSSLAGLAVVTRYTGHGPARAGRSAGLGDFPPQGSKPSDAVILRATRALWVLRKEDATGI